MRRPRGRAARAVGQPDDDADGHRARHGERDPAQAASTSTLARLLKEKFEHRIGFGARGVEVAVSKALISKGHDATIIIFMSVSKSSDPDPADAGLDLSPLDRADPTLLHEQVAAEIRRAIADGEAQPGEKIPQAKDLAAELGVNTNTVLRALRVLRDEGVIEMGRGRSTRVTTRPDRAAVTLKLKELVELARRHGYRRDDLVEMLEQLPGR